jgi:hypothetical protein
MIKNAYDIYMNKKLVITHPNGSTQGVDPRDLSPEQLESAGHHKAPLLQVIRAKCLDCCSGCPAEVRRCTATGCFNWPYRMGTNPFSKRPGNAEALARAREKRCLGKAKSK